MNFLLKVKNKTNDGSTKRHIYSPTVSKDENLNSQAKFKRCYFIRPKRALYEKWDLRKCKILSLH
jgi:hypothetical protein